MGSYFTTTLRCGSTSGQEEPRVIMIIAYLGQFVNILNKFPHLPLHDIVGLWALTFQFGIGVI